MTSEGRIRSKFRVWFAHFGRGLSLIVAAGAPCQAAIVYDAGPSFSEFASKMFVASRTPVQALPFTVFADIACPAGQKVWDGGGSTNNWSEAANWCDNTLPNSGSAVVFDGTSTKNATIDVNVTTFNLTIAPAYSATDADLTGTITMAPGVNAIFNNTSSQSGGKFKAGNGLLTFGSPGVGGGLDLAGGTFDAGGAQINILSVFNQTGGIFNGGSAIIVVGHPRFNGGSFNAVSSTIEVWGDLNFASNVFNSDGGDGTVVLYSTNRSLSMTGSEVKFNNLTINKDEGHRIVIGDSNRTVRVTGALTLTEGGVNSTGSSSVLKAEGPVNIGAAFGNADDGSFNNAVGGNAVLLIKDGPAGRSIDWPATASLPHVRLEDSNVTVTVTGTALARSGAITLANGNIEVPTASLKIGHGASTINALDQSSGLFHIGSGDFNLLTGSFRLTGGTFTMESGNATLSCLSATISGGEFNASSGTTTICPDESINGVNGTLRVDNTGKFNSGSGTLNINHRVEIAGGTFIASSGNTRLGFVLAYSAGTFAHNGGTVIFDSIHPSYSITVPSTPPTNFNNVRFDLLDPNGSVSLQGNFVVNGQLTFANGSVTIGPVQAKGNVVTEPAADGGNSAITFNGAGPQTFTNNGGANITGTFTVNKPVGTALTAATSMILGTSQALNVTSGTLYLGHGSNLSAGAVTVGANGKLGNDSSTTITLGGTLSNSGVVDLQGGGAACPGDDLILIRSTVSGTQRPWNGTGRYRLVDVDVQDMGGSGAVKKVYSGTDSGGNNLTTWDFSAGDTCPPEVSISPSTANVTSGGTQQFTGGGGFPSYSFSIPVNNSGATINSSTGLYAAGATGNVTDTVRVTDLFGATADATVTVFNAPARLALISQPASAAAGQSIPAFQVAVQDASGATVVSATGPVTISIQNNAGDPPGILSGTVTRNAVNGIATFNDLSIDSSGSGYTLRASSGSLAPATSVGFTIFPGPATNLVFVTQPTDALMHAFIAPPPSVEVRDQFGNPVIGGGPVTVALGNNPSGGTIGGTLTKNTIQGVASFNDLRVNAAGGGYTLIASVEGLPPTESSSFSILNPFIVTNANNSGVGSLRQAILSSNSTFATELISFNIPGSGPFTIEPASDLPTITQPVIIDATTQPGFAGSPIVELSGAGLPFAAGQTTRGLTINTGSSTVKGLVINRFDFGISISGGGGNVIQGNYIGVDPAGSEARDASIGIAISGTGSTDNLIGGTDPEDRNVIVASGKAIEMTSNSNASAPTFNLIQGNYIGTNAAGTADLAGPTATGITISSAENTIGGTSAGAGNLISGNETAIRVFGPGNIIRGNRIGTDAAGILPVPNQRAMNVYGSNTTIGGPEPGAGNVVAFNSTGISIFATVNGIAVNNAIRGNSIHSNTQCGIDLTPYTSPCPPTPNDPGDQDDGPNHLQNFPVLNAAASSAGATNIKGTLNSTASQLHRLDFYANPACDGSGYGEGKTYLGSVAVSTDASSLKAFDVTFPIETPIGHFITATATSADNDTSEFSQCKAVSLLVLSISGRVTDDGGAPLGNLVVQLSGGRSAAATTNSNGEYRFNDLSSQSDYTVTPTVRTGYAFAPAGRTYTNLTTIQTNQNFVGTKVRFNISGRLTSAVDESPLPCVQMRLSGARTFSLTTCGTYDFRGNLPPGIYEVTPVHIGWTFSPSSAQVTITNADRTVDFAATPVSSLQGRIVYARSGTIGSVNADGSAAALFPQTLTATDVSVSRDGKKLVYTKTPTGSGGKGLYVSDADASNEVNLIRGSATLDHLHPEWSPDGTKIAFVQISSGRRAIRVRNANGSVFSVPTPGLANQTHPTWLSNNRIAFSAATTTLSFLNIYAVNVDGSILANLTGNAESARAPSASPDGTKIAFRGGFHQFGALVVMSSTGANPTTIRSDAMLVKPAWSPDGTKIAYRQYPFSPEGIEQIVVVNATDGSDLQTVREVPAGSISWGRSFQFPHTTGSDRVVNLGATRVTYASVGVGGATTLIPLWGPTVGRLPAGYAADARAFQIASTASYLAPVEVCLKVSASAFSTSAAFDHAVLLHVEGGAFVDRTISRNFTTRTVCAEVPVLGGPFVLVYQSGPPAERIGEDFASITGVAIDTDGEPLSEVLVQLTGTDVQYTYTDVIGNFCFLGLTPGGNYNVQPKLHGYTFSEHSETITNLIGEQTFAFVGTPSVFGINGRVTDEKGIGIEGTGVNIEGSASNSTTTDAAGNYSFTDLPADGSFSVAPFGEGLFEPISAIIDPLTSNAGGVDFAKAPVPAMVTISGRALTREGGGIAKATLSLTDPFGVTRTVFTNSFGYYQFFAVPTGSAYSLNVSSRRYRFGNRSRTLYLNGALADEDFVASK